jgi:hypothetical protein
MKPAAQLIAEGRAAAPHTIPITAFLRSKGASSEAEYKCRSRGEGRLMYHTHMGRSTWAATEDALHTGHDALAAEGNSVDRFGLAFDRAMGVPEIDRHLTTKETSPRTCRGLAAGITALHIRCVERVEDLLDLLAHNLPEGTP